MTPFEAYKKYVALKLHFSTDKYDFFTYGGQIKAKIESFESRNDKYYFEKVVMKFNREEYQNFLVANFVKDENIWIGDLFSSMGSDNYIEWQRINQAMNHYFELDMKILKKCIDIENISHSFSTLFQSKNGYYPPLLTLVLQKEINLETFVIMNKIFDFFPKFDRMIDEDLIWPSFKKKCLKYSPFVKFDSNVYKAIMRQEFIN